MGVTSHTCVYYMCIYIYTFILVPMYRYERLDIRFLDLRNLQFASQTELSLSLFGVHASNPGGILMNIPWVFSATPTDPGTRPSIHVLSKRNKFFVSPIGIKTAIKTWFIDGL